MKYKHCQAPNCDNELTKQQKKFCCKQCHHDHRSYYKPKPALRDEAWSLLSKYIRLKAAGHNEMARCYTCGKAKHYKELEGGHWIHGKTRACYLEEENANPQCTSCNYYGGGEMMRKYTLKIQNELSEEKIEWLEKRSRETYTKDEVREKIKEYKKKLKQLKNKELDL